MSNTPRYDPSQPRPFKAWSVPPSQPTIRLNIPWAGDSVAELHLSVAEAISLRDVIDSALNASFHVEEALDVNRREVAVKEHQRGR